MIEGTGVCYSQSASHSRSFIEDLLTPFGGDDLDKAVANYEAFLGVKAVYALEGEARFIVGLDDIGYDYQAESAQFKLPDMRLTLMTSTDESSPVGRFLAKRGEGLLMISMEVDDAKQETERIKTKGLQLVMGQSASGSFGATNFIHPKALSGVQFEIFKPGGTFKK